MIDKNFDILNRDEQWDDFKNLQEEIFKIIMRINNSQPEKKIHIEKPVEEIIETHSIIRKSSLSEKKFTELFNQELNKLEKLYGIYLKHNNHLGIKSKAVKHLIFSKISTQFEKVTLLSKKWDFNLENNQLINDIKLLILNPPRKPKQRILRVQPIETQQNFIDQNTLEVKPFNNSVEINQNTALQNNEIIKKEIFYHISYLDKELAFIKIKLYQFKLIKTYLGHRGSRSIR